MLYELHVAARPTWQKIVLARSLTRPLRAQRVSPLTLWLVEERQRVKLVERKFLTVSSYGANAIG